MATLVLSAVGTAIAGPFGSAIGGLIGRQVDQAVFGSGSTEGPRLTELSVTTSSYGQPIPRRFGRMRAAGTIIWATDLTETSGSEGGKGQPSTTTYSYSVSFAVAISSVPIAEIGRIWADGELLRGANGDLKVAGTLRAYLGNGDDVADPLILVEQGGEAPAFRDCAYVVFEDLDLAEFGNRIPALTFEVFSPDSENISLTDLVPENSGIESSAILDHARGFADEGGPVSSSLAAIDRIFPLTAISNVEGVVIVADGSIPNDIPVLSEQLSEQDSEEASERHRQRAGFVAREPLALRYYDEGLDYQPGVQRAVGRRGGGSETMIDLPATLTADGAKQLVNSKAHRSRWFQEQITWRTGELDPAIMPGSMVKLPGYNGNWLVASWEWHERGIELSLRRAAPNLAPATGADSGSANTAEDIALMPTILQAFEVPPDGTSNSTHPNVFAAATSRGSGWRGSALYVEQGDSLVPIGTTAPRPAISGTLVSPIPGSQSFLIEPNSSFEVELPSENMSFEDTDMNGIAAGANRVLIGSEVLQFLHADPLGGKLWKLSALLRGRAGTEDAALIGHQPGSIATLLDSRITRLDPTLVPSNASTRIAAIALGDKEAVIATLHNAGLSRRPPSPVHAKSAKQSDGTVIYSWTRRARGSWRWENGVETPLIEEQEIYRIGYGSVSAPFATWTATIQEFPLSLTEHHELIAQHGQANLWVSQVGTHAVSPALFLVTLS